MMQSLGKKTTVLVTVSAEPLCEGKPEMDIGWQLPYAPQWDTVTLCEGSLSQDGMRLVI
jgi:hypothetical protein